MQFAVLQSEFWTFLDSRLRKKKRKKVQTDFWGPFKKSRCAACDENDCKNRPLPSHSEDSGAGAATS